MKELSIKRVLSDTTKKKEIEMYGTIYSLHMTLNGEVIITDRLNYDKIYSVQSMDFYKLSQAAG